MYIRRKCYKLVPVDWNQANPGSIFVEHEMVGDWYQVFYL